MTDQFGTNKAELKKPVILVMTECYLPGHKGGGPIYSIGNLVDALGTEFEFRILTADRDYGDTKKYVGIERNTWLPLKGAAVMYLSPGFGRLARILHILIFEKYDLLYLNSYFNRMFSMIAIWLNYIRVFKKIPVLIAPRGEFSVGALKIKSKRKTFYINASNLIRMYKNVIWHASSEYEKTDIERVFSNANLLFVARPLSSNKILVASDLASCNHTNIRNLREKKIGELKIVFISRICRKKNLDFALKTLCEVKGNISFGIYGPIEDKNYWKECTEIIANLPKNVVVNYEGELKHEEVFDVFKNSHVFLFPTYGENYGHVIIESLISGCPVIISDQTPWRHLSELEIGWDLPLDNVNAFSEAIETCVQMRSADFERMSQSAEKFALKMSENENIITSNRNMFTEVVGRERSSN